MSIPRPDRHHIKRIDYTTEEREDWKQRENLKRILIKSRQHVIFTSVFFFPFFVYFCFGRGGRGGGIIWSSWFYHTSLTAATIIMAKS